MNGVSRTCVIDVEMELCTIDLVCICTDCITTRNIIGVNLHVSGSSAVRPGLFNVNVHLDENLCI